MVLLSSQHALTTHYIPYMFYEMLLPSDGSLKTSLILFCFFLQGLILLWGLPRLVSLSANACMMFDCRLHSGEAEEQERIITTRRTFPQETVTHYLLSLLTPPSLLMLVVLLFHRPVLEIISYCCFFFFFFIVVIIFFFCCCSDETFFSDVEVASCVLWRLLCAQLSAVKDESFEGLRRGQEEEVWGVLLEQWFPAFLGSCHGPQFDKTLLQGLELSQYFDTIP